MPPTFDLATLQFGEPLLLWLLVCPAAVLLLLVRHVQVRRRDARRMSAVRLVPVRERFPILGDAMFWLCAILASACLIVALAQPQVVASTVRRAGVDIVVLLDGSASMHVTDVEGTRWQRSIRFLRTLGDSLRWDNDRMALTLFAHIAAPQVRLTRDPNTFFFFLDHLSDRPPFRLEDDTSWDTNIALGIEWGLRLIERDEELRGRNPNAKQFVLLSDGQAWSGVVQDALQLARARGVPIFVVGVGTLQGGTIPDPRRVSNPNEPVIASALDRGSLTAIATASGGRYLELDRGSDVDLANQIIDAARRRAVAARPEPTMQPVYWQFLFLAGWLMAGGVLFLRDRADLGITVLSGSLVLAVVTALLRP
jgi:Ca-activated chloride channel family protein